MNLKYERSDQTTVEWYTPPKIINCLGNFDLDPCTSDFAHTLNHSATHFFTKENDGLTKDWFGRVWLNPPYKQPLITDFIIRMADHNNGIALLYSRCDNKLFQQIIFPSADSLYFLSNRIRFIDCNGNIGNSPGCGSVLISWGEANTMAVQNSGLQGTMFKPVFW